MKLHAKSNFSWSDLFIWTRCSNKGCWRKLHSFT